MSASSYSPAVVRKLIDTIGEMATEEHAQILHILQQHGCRYTENLNGVFVNLSHVPDAGLTQLMQFVQFWKDQQQHIQQSEEQRSALTTVHASAVMNMSALDDDKAASAVVVHRAAASCGKPMHVKPPLNPMVAGVFNETKTANTHDATLTAAERKRVQAKVHPKRKQLTLHKKGKKLLKGGGSVARVAKKCVASEDDRVQALGGVGVGSGSGCLGGGGGVGDGGVGGGGDEE